MSLDMIKDSLKNVRFVSLSCDCSNRGNKKILPVMVRYFSFEEGIQCKLIDLFCLDDETGETVFNRLKTVIENFGLQPKFVCFGADNCVMNFGGINRGGDKNVFARLKEKFGDKLIGIGCNAHLAQKAIEQACHKFQSHFDIEAIVVNIYSYFKNITVRNTRLQQMCSETANDVKLLGYSNTRFIGLKNCISRILQHFDLLQTFFTDGEEADAPIALIRFFEHQLAKLLLIFVHDQCQLFENTIKNMEGTYVSAFEAVKQMKQLVLAIESRKEENFTSLEFQREMDKVENELPFEDTILTKKNNRTQYTEVLVNSPYLQEIFHRFYGINFR